MSGAGTEGTALDLRAPIGALFSALGMLLAGYGFATAGDPMYARSAGINLNLWWGGVMLAFGVLMLWGARRAARRGGAAPG